jgi:ABC-2 type transport system ATP-binding protein
MIEIRGLVKRFGQVTAVDGLSFDVMPGRVTGFLGPNGAGKTTTMLMMLGLVRPGAGEVRIGGRRYRDLPVPLTEAGVLLEGRAFHGGRRARDHLLFLARSNRIPARRVGEVLALTGIGQAAGRRAKALSLGMAQRLGIAAALLGDPAVLVLDEPLVAAPAQQEGPGGQRLVERELGKLRAISGRADPAAGPEAFVTGRVLG